MAIGQGTIFTASEVKNQLREANKGNNLWAKAYGDIDNQTSAAYAKLGQQYDTTSSQLGTQYQQSVADAYKAAASQRTSFENSSVGQGYKDYSLAENEAALKQAYDSYRASYLNERSGLEQSLYSSAQSVASSAASARAEVDKTLDEQAKNVADYGNAYFEYISWLREKDPELFNKENWIFDAKSDKYLTVQGMFDLMHNEDGSLSEIGKEYTEYLGNKPISWSSKTDYDGFRDWLIDKHGDQYSRPAFRSGLGLQNTDGDLESLSPIVFNSDDELTERGMKFFDEVNKYSSNGKNSFGDFLAEEHPELLEWGSGRDDFVYGGKNYHLFQAMTGRGPYADREK